MTSLLNEYINDYQDPCTNSFIWKNTIWKDILAIKYKWSNSTNIPEIIICFGEIIFLHPVIVNFIGF